MRISCMSQTHIEEEGSRRLLEHAFFFCIILQHAWKHLQTLFIEQPISGYFLSEGTHIVEKVLFLLHLFPTESMTVVIIIISSSRHHIVHTEQPRPLGPTVWFPDTAVHRRRLRRTQTFPHHRNPNRHLPALPFPLDGDWNGENLTWRPLYVLTMSLINNSIFNCCVCKAI